jgi:hypothetical protein
MPYSRRARFEHEDRSLAFEPERIRTVVEPNGTEVRLGFRDDRSEVVSVLRPKRARVTAAKGVERYMNEWVLYGGLPARRRDVIADARAQAERIAPGDRARQERLVGTIVLGAGDAIAPPDAVPDGPTAFDVWPVTSNGPVRRIVPVRRSRRARAHPRRLT